MISLSTDTNTIYWWTKKHKNIIFITIRQITPAVTAYQLEFRAFSVYGWIHSCKNLDSSIITSSEYEWKPQYKGKFHFHVSSLLRSRMKYSSLLEEAVYKIKFWTESGYSRFRRKFGTSFPYSKDVSRYETHPTDWLHTVAEITQK